MGAALVQKIIVFVHRIVPYYFLWGSVVRDVIWWLCTPETEIWQKCSYWDQVFAFADQSRVLVSEDNFFSDFSISLLQKLASACICSEVFVIVFARLDQMFSDAFAHDHQLLKTDPRHGLYLACGLTVRGNVEMSDIRRNIDRYTQCCYSVIRHHCLFTRYGVKALCGWFGWWYVCWLQIESPTVQ